MRTTTCRPSVFLLGAATVFFSILPMDGDRATAASEPTGRDRPLEKAVVERLQNQRLGRDIRIAVLAVENRVFLLGAVPDVNTAAEAVQVAKNTPDVGQVENFLVVRPASAQKSGIELERAVQSKLRQIETIPPDTILPEAAGETVFLKGRAESWLALARAVQAAFAAGAGRVVTELSVAGPGESRTPQANRSRTRTSNVENSEEIVGQPTPAGKSYEPHWGQSAQDRRLQRALDLRLRQDVPDAQDFFVLVKNGQAFLYGRVRSQQEKQQASRIAQETAGIVRYRNQLLVAEQGWRERPDAEIEDAIREDLNWNPFVSTNEIKVDVTLGVATLSGTADGFAAVLAAVDSAFLGGARSVINELEVAGPSSQSEAGGTAPQQSGVNQKSPG